jgi:probable rRNA maturation factor
MILNRQHDARVYLRGLKEFLARAQRALHLRAEALTVCLVSNAQMARWNRAYRGKKGPTDVLSFPAHPSVEGRMRNLVRTSKGRRTKDGFPPASSASSVSSASSASYLGDIAIAPAVARQNARRFGRTLDDELRILVLHGILHLMGYDHETDRGQMERREQRLRRKLGLA